MVNQAFRIKITYRSKEKKEEKKEEKIPGIGRCPMCPTNILDGFEVDQFFSQLSDLRSIKMYLIQKSDTCISNLT